ncbi:MAG: ribbon-helix-helix protein, CopG family [Gemmatimonadetes bacterium]|nr:ribbon-helix-helix protein, CopG family [Gemmatimonadota bacterium]
MAEKVKASYYLSGRIAKAVRLLAAKQGRSQSEVAEAALQAYVAGREEDQEWLAAAEAAENRDDSAYDSKGAAAVPTGAAGPPSLAGEPAALVDLVRRGLARFGARNAPSLYPALPRLAPEGTATRLLEEERGER